MGIILIVLTFFLSQYVLYRELRKASACLEISLKNHQEIESQLDAIRNKLTEIDHSFVALNAEQRRTLLDFKDSLETTKPIKPNNWDSVKEAFKGPVRATINERN